LISSRHSVGPAEGVQASAGLMQTARPGQPSTLFPFLDLKAQFAAIRDDVMQAIERVMESQHFILGAGVESFENSMVALTDARYAVSCASGSDALLLSLLALGIGSGDEVITTPYTFVATAGAIARTGAKPVFVDILPDTFNINPAQIRHVISERTRAIIPVHLFGLPADLDPILQMAEKHQLAVIEDAAQAISARYHGAPVGSLGTLGCFSFFPSKNLGGAGDGGLVTTNDPKLAARVRLLRVHGSSQKYQYEILGINSRMDALQAAILSVKMIHLETWTASRQHRANRYQSLFAESGLEKVVQLPSAPPGCEHVYNQFVVLCPERDRLREFLRDRGIPTEVYYPQPLHLQQAFAYLGYRSGQFPHAEAACRKALALPIHPELSDENQMSVASAITAFYNGTIRYQESQS
jgi:dTDP-4-amino-4,6-dideoxygalactose transaminase